MVRRLDKFYSGGVLIVLGLAVAYQSMDYQIGALSRMGPGYFPLLLGVALALMGLLIVVLPGEPSKIGTDRPAEKKEGFLEKKLRPWCGITLAFVAFIVFGKYGGLIPASFASILIAALGDRENTLKTSVLLAIGVTVFSVIVFHYLMNLQFPLLGWN